MRITHLDSRSVLAFAGILGVLMLVMDLVAVIVVWIAISIMGIPEAMGIGLGLGPILAVGLLLGIIHGVATAVMTWLAGTAFNLSAAWTGGLSVRTGEEEMVVLPDTRFGAARRAGVTSPSRSAVEKVAVEHVEGL